jgi:hypothetical protein
MSFQQDAVREWAYITGYHYPEQEWLLSNYDTWEKNPCYTGTPGRHPEDNDWEDADSPQLEHEACFYEAQDATETDMPW